MNHPIRVVTTAFNEEDFIDVFLTYYLNQGVERIVVFDHGSTDGTAARAARYGPRIEVVAFDPHPDGAVYTLADDEKRCETMFRFALADSAGPCWWIFPDVDELIQPGPDESGRLADRLAELDGVDGVPCVGLHCLSSDPEDLRFGWPAEQLLPVLGATAPPRSFQSAHADGEAWKVPVWFFGADAATRFAGLRPSSGRHLLVGDTAHLRYHRPAWVVHHHKVRAVSRFLAHSDDLIARASADESYREMLVVARDRVRGWAAGRYRLLRLAPILTRDEIAAACRATRPPGVYLENPFHPDRWGKE